MAETDTILPVSRAAARNIGAKFYFTGKACRNGHVDRRSVATTQCNSCRKDKYVRSGAKEYSTRRYWSTRNTSFMIIGRLLQAAKKRAESQNLAFEITRDDLLLPEKCPVFGTPLVVGDRRCTGDSPSVDRVVPELGYVPGNVRIISLRANRLKSNGTEEELRALVRYMDEHRRALSKECA